MFYKPYINRIFCYEYGSSLAIIYMLEIIYIVETSTKF